MNFLVKPYDPIDEAIQNFVQFNDDPQNSDHTEEELVRLAVHAVKQHDATA